MKKQNILLILHRGFLSALLAFAVFCSTPHAGVEIGSGTWREVLFKPSTLPALLKKKVADLSVQFEAKYLSLSAFEGLGLAARYRYQYQPDYQDGYYTRLDSWKVSANLFPGDLLADATGIPISFQIEAGKEIQFIRHFENWKKAMRSLPMHVKHLPLNAKKVLKYLQPGDFVSIPTRLNLLLQARTPAFAPVLNAGFGGHVLVHGDFQVQVLKALDKKVRLRLIAEAGQETTWFEGNSTVGFQIFGMKLFGKDIETFTEIELMKFGFSKASGNLLVLDYLFDLSDESAAKAYDAVLSSCFGLKAFKSMAKFAKDKDDKQLMVADLTLADEIASQGKDASVQQLFKGFSSYKQNNRMFKLGIGFFKYQKGSSYTESNVNYQKGKYVNLNYLFTNMALARMVGNFVQGNRGVLQSASGLFLKDRKERIRGIKDFSFGYHLKDEKYTDKEQRQTRNFLLMNLSPVLTSESISNYCTSEDLESVNLDFQVYFHRAAFHALEDVTREVLQSEFSAYKTSLEERFGFLELKESELNEMLDLICDVLAEHSGELSVRERIKKSMTLRRNKVFNELGIGFVLHLLKGKPLEELLYVGVTRRALHYPVFEFRYGDVRQSDLYRQLQYTQSMLNERTLEIREDHLEQQMSEYLDAPSAPALKLKTQRFHELYGDEQ